MIAFVPRPAGPLVAADSPPLVTDWGIFDGFFAPDGSYFERITHRDGGEMWLTFADTSPAELEAV